MVARYYGKEIPLQTLRERAEIGKEGTNLLGITEAAESIGFRTRAVKLSYSVLSKEALLPCILFWNQVHFVVLYKAGRRLSVADPGIGRMRLSREEFGQRWICDGAEEGVALLLEPTAAFYSARYETPSRRKIFHYLLPYKRLVVQLMIGLIAGSLLQLMLPLLTQGIVDIGIHTSNLHFIFVVLLAQVALFAGRLGTDVLRNWILLHISTRINITLMADFLVKLLALPVSFFDSKRTGDILQRMHDRQRIEGFLTGPSINVLFSLAQLLIFSFVLAFFNPRIFAVFALAGLLYLIWAVAFLRYRRELDHAHFDVAVKEQSALIQLVQGMQEIKLHSMEKPMRLQWEKLQATLFRLTLRGQAIKNWQQSGASLINEGKNILITFLSAQAVIEGRMTLGMMLAVTYIVGQLNGPIEQMIGFVQSWQDAKISMDRLNEIHKMEDEEPGHLPLMQELPAAFTRQLAGGRGVVEGAMAVDGACCEAAIEFSDVSFRYPGAGSDPVLQHIDVRIPRGKTTAIVGVSGSGKTTLLKLLLKYYEPQQGEIRLGDAPLAGISHRMWRSHCGVVMQESYIFSDTIERNIAVGVETVDAERLRHAVRVARMEDLIASLPLGFNTKIGADGTGISMGQKQRILIARAVYRDPAIILFDEATNSLDAINESAILQNLESFFTGKTVVVVAHRLSTVKNADQIVVLDRGRIAERGTHRELVNARGVYYTLVKNQLELGD
jgi:ATP-binding cassette subfamily B protein